jgi:hypothetical protein
VRIYAQLQIYLDLYRAITILTALSQALLDAVKRAAWFAAPGQRSHLTGSRENKATVCYLPAYVSLSMSNINFQHKSLPEGKAGDEAATDFAVIYQVSFEIVKVFIYIYVCICAYLF